MGFDEMINAARVGGKPLSIFYRNRPRVLFGDSPRAQPARLAISFYGRLPDYLRQLSAGESAKRIHLPQPILRRDISLKKDCVLTRRCLDVRHTVAVSGDGSFTADGSRDDTRSLREH